MSLGEDDVLSERCTAHAALPVELGKPLNVSVDQMLRDVAPFRATYDLLVGEVREGWATNADIVEPPGCTYGSINCA